jgi:hypothetical protein
VILGQPVIGPLVEEHVREDDHTRVEFAELRDMGASGLDGLGSEGVREAGRGD